MFGLLQLFTSIVSLCFYQWMHNFMSTLCISELSCRHDVIVHQLVIIIDLLGGVIGFLTVFLLLLRSQICHNLFF